MLKMKNKFFKFFASLSFSSLAVFTGQVNVFAGEFTPTKLELTFYEIGLVNENDADNRFKVFESADGTSVDVASPGVNKVLSSGIKPKAGTWTHLYGIVSPSWKASGTDGSCYLTSGSDTSTNYVFAGVTSTNSANAGTATMTYSQLSIDGAGPSEQAISQTFNGTPAGNMYIYLANSSDLFTPTLVDPDRLIFYGKLTTPFTTRAGNAGGEVENSFTLENSYVMNAACTEITGSGKAKYGLSVLEY